ncbi:MAG TPA: phosphoenolpyruvate carboxykinase (GTP) [Rhabdochlamydiaceae bacterium]
MDYKPALQAWTKNQRLTAWIEEAIALCQPDKLHLCTGSEEEYSTLTQQLVEKNLFIPLNAHLRPNSFLCRSSINDVARVEEATFICSPSQADAGPTNNWKEPNEMLALLKTKFSGAMRGRTLYVIPFSMGPLGSPFSYIGVQITDSAYVVCSMRIMTRMGKGVLEVLQEGDFIPCMHTVGYPLSPGQKDLPWPCHPHEKYIVHFPRERSIWSFGSGYGGNALLGKKSFALRIASVLAKDEGWLAEHMLIMGITNPQGVKKYFVAAFPSACGKTNLAMLTPAVPGWKVECVGDDIAWMRFGADGRLYAVNPESGFFGVAPGTSYTSNPNAMKTIEKNAIFTNVALNREGDVWWEGMTPSAPAHLIDWQGREWTPSSKERAAHPNARFTVPAAQSPVIDPAWEDPAGVPISAIIFGGRRSNVVPLVFESFNWQHGTFVGACVSSEMTAAAKGGETGKLRHDPFAMLPFCGYHMGDYFRHWLTMGQTHDSPRLPRIFHVNWFQKDEQGRILWPGYGENIRVLQWIFDRTGDGAPTLETPIGWTPTPNALNLEGLNLSPMAVERLLFIDRLAWRKEVDNLQEYFTLFGDKLPREISQECTSLSQRLTL